MHEFIATIFLVQTRVILPGEKALMVDRFNTKLYMSFTLANMSHI